MRQLKYGLIIAATLVVAGCASTGENVNVPVVDSRDTPSQSDGATLEPETTAYIKNVPPTKPGDNPAVLSLMERAVKQQQAGDYVGAARSLERAIRISPRYGELYYRLSEVRFGQQNFGQSEQLCRKAISLASGDNDLLARSRLLMAKAKQAQGGY